MQKWWFVPHYTYCLLTVQETDGLQRIMTNYQKHNQVMSHIVVAVLMWCSYLRRSTHLLVHGLQLLMQQIFFFSLVPIHKATQKQFSFIWHRENHTFTILPQGSSEVGISSLNLGHTFWWYPMCRIRKKEALIFDLLPLPLVIKFIT